MRIRKRQPPLPLSDPLSDTSMVVQVHNGSNHHHPHHCLPQLGDSSYPQPSDHPNRPIRTGSNGFDSSDNDEKKDCLVLLQKEHEKGVEEKKSNDSRKKTMLGAQFVGTAVVNSHESSSSHQAGGRWCEGEKAFPLKKRRGSFERKANEEMIVEKDNKKMKTKMKTKMNKKFSVKDDGSEQQEEGGGGGERKESGASENSGAKKRGRGGALMEGSRCSRVNGRGWRCCQQTLVGYSLCEHHLGKGRLRSMTSVRSRALGTSAAPPSNKIHDSTASATHPPLSTTSLSIQESHEPKLEDQQQDEDDEKPLMITAAKKRMKLGMVKARSISSLLGQTNNEITVSDK